MHGIEGHGGHGREESPLVLPVSITIAILAVLVAVATLFGHRSHTEELLLQAKASDQWAYYQAKNGRLNTDQAIADLLGAVSVEDKEKAAALRGKYLKDVERYSTDKDDISEKATELEKERDRYQHRADRFDASEGILEFALIVCSITLLTNKKFFWFGGILIGLIGLLVALSGFLVHL